MISAKDKWYAGEQGGRICVCIISTVTSCFDRLLFLNPTFLCMTLAGAGDAAMIAGFAAFGPKYMQNQFSISAASAGIIFGGYSVFT